MARFEKGIPYAETLARLNEAFQPKTGDLITNEALRAVCQPCDENRYRGVLAAWMKQLRKQGLKPTRQERAKGVGVAFLRGREEVVLVDKTSGHVTRRVKKLADQADKVDTAEFTDPEQAQHNLRKRLLRETAKSVEKSNKELHAPAAVVSSNVRLLKTN